MPASKAQREAIRPDVQTTITQDPNANELVELIRKYRRGRRANIASIALGGSRVFAPPPTVDPLDYANARGKVEDRRIEIAKLMDSIKNADADTAKGRFELAKAQSDLLKTMFQEAANNLRISGTVYGQVLAQRLDTLGSLEKSYGDDLQRITITNDTIAGKFYQEDLTKIPARGLPIKDTQDFLAQILEHTQALAGDDQYAYLENMNAEVLSRYGKSLAELTADSMDDPTVIETKQTGTATELARFLPTLGDRSARLAALEARSNLTFEQLRDDIKKEGGVAGLPKATRDVITSVEKMRAAGLWDPEEIAHPTYKTGEGDDKTAGQAELAYLAGLDQSARDELARLATPNRPIRSEEDARRKLRGSTGFQNLAAKALDQGVSEDQLIQNLIREQRKLQSGSVLGGQDPRLLETVRNANDVRGEFEDPPIEEQIPAELPESSVPSSAPVYIPQQQAPVHERPASSAEGDLGQAEGEPQEGRSDTPGYNNPTAAAEKTQNLAGARIRAFLKKFAEGSGSEGAALPQKEDVA